MPLTQEEIRLIVEDAFQQYNVKKGYKMWNQNDRISAKSWIISIFSLMFVLTSSLFIFNSVDQIRSAKAADGLGGAIITITIIDGIGGAIIAGIGYFAFKSWQDEKAKEKSKTACILNAPQIEPSDPNYASFVQSISVVKPSYSIPPKLKWYHVLGVVVLTMGLNYFLPTIISIVSMHIK